MVEAKVEVKFLGDGGWKERHRLRYAHSSLVFLETAQRKGRVTMLSAISGQARKDKRQEGQKGRRTRRHKHCPRRRFLSINFNPCALLLVGEHARDALLETTGEQQLSSAVSM
jgi:hypothetical protein